MANSTEKAAAWALNLYLQDPGKEITMFANGNRMPTDYKWLTEPDHNVEFVTRTGYMPVTRAAFENELPKAIEGLESAKYASLYEAYLDTQANYEFYVPPQLETYLSLETALEDHVRAQLALGRQDYLNAGETGLEQISAERLEAFRELMER